MTLIALVHSFRIKLYILSIFSHQTERWSGSKVRAKQQQTCLASTRERIRPTTAAMQLHRRCAETAQFRGYDGVMHYRLAVQPTLHGADRIAFR